MDRRWSIRLFLDNAGSFTLQASKMKEFSLWMLCGLGLLVISSCGPAVAENLPDTRQQALAKPVVPKPKVVESPPAVPNPPPTDQQVVAPPTQDQGIVVEQVQPKPVRTKQPCNDQDREMIAGMRKNIDQSRAYLKTIEQDDLEYHQVFLEINDQETTLAEYLETHDCE